MALTIHFLRHGQTEFSRDNMFCGAGTDAALTAEGVEMAVAFGSAYKDVNWAAIYSSPMQRARHTVQPLCEQTKISAQIDERLREIEYGAWEGQTIENVKRDFPEAYRAWELEPALFAPTGGETAVQVTERGIDFVTSVRETHSDGEILAVSHKATIRLIICKLFGLDLAQYRRLLSCPVSSIAAIQFNPTGPMLLTLGDRAHLATRLRNLAGT